MTIARTCEIRIYGNACLSLIALWGGYLLHRLGGQSGDLLGAGNQLAEAAVLLVLLWSPA